MKKERKLSTSLLTIALALAVIGIAAFLFMNEGFLKGNELEKSLEKINTSPNLDITLKGSAALDIPVELVANSYEAELIKNAKDITYHLQQKSTPKVTYLDADISLGNSNFLFKSYADDREALMFNGSGWYHSEDNKNISELNIQKAARKVLESISGGKQNSIKKSKATINYNGEALKTNLYTINLGDDSLKEIGNSFKLEIEKMDLMVFIEGETPKVIQYSIVLKKGTEFGQPISGNLEGQLLFDSIGKNIVEPPTPDVSKSYRTFEDFMIELLLPKK